MRSHSFDLSLVPDGGVRWLDASGPHPEIVVSTRIRLARNVQGYAFSGKARDGERLRILGQVEDSITGLTALSGSILARLDRFGLIERQLLHERHLISKELAGLEIGQTVRPGAAVILGEQSGIQVNEEDHLRLQVMRSGFDVDSAWQQLIQIDDQLGNRLPYAFHREFGFLTACPTNVGTGLRASVLIHLPGLVMTKEIGRAMNGLKQLGLTYRGLYGEGSEVIGDLFQLSNQTTLGRPEEELVDLITGVVRHLIDRECEARRVLLRDSGYIVEDSLWRAYGILRYARSLSFRDVMHFLSKVRLGVSLKLIPGLSVYTLNKIMIFSQSAHLSHSEGRTLTSAESSLARARYVRQALATEGGGVE